MNWTTFKINIAHYTSINTQILILVGVDVETNLHIIANKNGCVASLVSHKENVPPVCTEY